MSVRKDCECERKEICERINEPPHNLLAFSPVLPRIANLRQTHETRDTRHPT